jgi:tetratricopeptide (TPR) repeat protein
MMKTITFYSYKGGVGRSLALSNIAERFAEFGKKVCVMDFDLDAPGLQFKFNNYTQGKITNGLMDYIHLHSCNGVTPENIKDFAIDLVPKSSNFQPIKFIPAGNIDDSNYWKKLSMIKWHDMFYSEHGDGIGFFLDLKAKIEKEFQPDFLLIDSRTGITDISGITLKLFADEVVILAANNEENMFGCKRIIQNLKDSSQSLFGKSPNVNFVLTRLSSDNENKDAILEKRRAELMNTLKGEHIDIMLIHSDRRLEVHERPLIGYEYEKGISISNDYLKLFDILSKDALSSSDQLRFRNVKLAETEILKAQSEKELSFRAKHFTKAIELDNTKIEYYIIRGNNYMQLENWEAAIEDFKKAVTDSSSYSKFNLNIGFCYYKKQDYETALNYLNKIDDLEAAVLKIQIYKKTGESELAADFISYVLNINPDHHKVLNIRANRYRALSLFKEAYRDIFKALELSPDNPVYFATLAEIYATENKTNEFYLNISIALKLGLKLSDIESTKNVYAKYINEERFISLLSKYNMDPEELRIIEA